MKFLRSKIVCCLSKPTKCKVMLQNLIEAGDGVMLNGVILEIVKEHKYLGTIVESAGRAKDIYINVLFSMGSATVAQF